MTTWSPHVLALSLALLLAGACSPSDSDAEEPPLGSATTAATPLRVMAGWTGDEEAAFRQVLAGFTRETGVPVEFQGIEDDLPDILWTRIELGVYRDELAIRSHLMAMCRFECAASSVHCRGTLFCLFVASSACLRG